MEKKYLKLNDINVYKIAFNLSNYVWDIVVQWEWFAKKHIGGQFVESMLLFWFVIARALRPKQSHREKEYQFWEIASPQSGLAMTFP